MNRFENKIALVTGGSSGIGRRTVERFVSEGATVITTGSSPESVERTQAELGDAVTVLPADALDLDAQSRLAATVAERFGALDVVVLNAGVSDWRPLQEWDEAGFDRVFNINVKAPFFLMQALLPQLSRGAAVVVTASNSALGGFPGGSVYGASKAAIRSFARGWILDLAPRRIRVNVLVPGPTSTPGLHGLSSTAEAKQAFVAAMEAQVPLGRMGTPDETAAAALFLASDESSFVNGSELFADGGQAQI